MKTYQEILSELKKRLDAERYNHTLRVEKTAEELANLYKIPVEKAKVAALLHDFAKNLSPKELLQIARDNHLDLDPTEIFEPKILHGPVSAILATKEFNITDDEILKAISHHTTGTENMGLLEKVIYLADHIEPERNYKKVDAVRKSAKKNMDKAIITCCISMIEYLLKNKKPICPKTIKTLNYYLLEGKNAA